MRAAMPTLSTPQLPELLLEALASHAMCVCTWSRPTSSMAWTSAHAERFGAPTLPRRIVLRAVRAGEAWNVRAESFTDRQSFTKVWQGGMEEVCGALLDVGYRQGLVQFPDADLQLLRNAKRMTVQRRSPSRHTWDDVAMHNAPKHVALDPTVFGGLLHALDLATADGAILAPMRDKYRQLNHLLSIIAHLEPVRSAQEGSTLRIVDAGCGKAYLSIAACAVLRDRGINVHLLGVDANPHVIDHCRRVTTELGMNDMCNFMCATIAEIPQQPIDLLLALHACDTATDEALALGIRSQARAMVIAPCCHHYVQTQLSKAHVPAEARPLLDDGIIRERLGDMLTDTMRRDICRVFGYDATLEEFIALEHTAKNVMLKCVLPHQATVTPVHPERLASLRTYSAAWHVHPKLFELISDLLP